MPSDRVLTAAVAGAVIAASAATYFAGAPGGQREVAGRPAFDGFHAVLTDEEKARLDNLFAHRRAGRSGR